MRTITVILLLLAFNKSIGQQENPEKSFDTYLSKSGINRLANNKFGSLVTGQATTPSLTNYAAFNPAAGSFTFNGSFPIGKATEDKGLFSYLSFRIAGDLASDNYTALFQNAKLNTNTSIQAQWDFRSHKSFKYHFYASDQFDLQVAKDKVEFQKKQKNELFTQQLSQQSHDSLLLSAKLKLNENNLTLQRSAINVCYDTLNKLMAMNPPPNINTIKEAADNIAKTKEAIAALEKENKDLKWQLDSTKSLLRDPDGLSLSTWLKIDQEHSNKIKLLEDSAATAGMKFTWFSVLSGTGRKSFYTFNAQRPFASQLLKQQLTTWRIGVMWNYYSERVLAKRVFLMNFGVIRYEDNNTPLLSTQDIAQDYVIKNAAGDTTRKISKTYKAYTDSVISNKVWNFVSNIYLMFASKKTGIHIYPSVDAYDHAKTISNIGIGYLISFKTPDKDKPVLNAEGYIQFQDLFNEQQLKKGFFRRNEIGIRFTLPFNFF